jgi:hypothetical protein
MCILSRTVGLSRLDGWPAAGTCSTKLVDDGILGLLMNCGGLNVFGLKRSSYGESVVCAEVGIPVDGFDLLVQALLIALRRIYVSAPVSWRHGGNGLVHHTDIALKADSTIVNCYIFCTVLAQLYHTNLLQTEDGLGDHIEVF